MSVAWARKRRRGPLPPPPDDIKAYLARVRRRHGVRALVGMAFTAIACLGPWGRFEHYTSILVYDMGVPHRLPVFVAATYRWGPLTVPWFEVVVLLVAAGVVFLKRGVDGSRRDVGWSICALAAALVTSLGVWVGYATDRWALQPSQDPATRLRGAIDSAGYGLKGAIVGLLFSIVMLGVLYRQGFWAPRRPEKKP